MKIELHKKSAFCIKINQGQPLFGLFLVLLVCRVGAFDRYTDDSVITCIMNANRIPVSSKTVFKSTFVKYYPNQRIFRLNLTGTFQSYYISVIPKEIAWLDTLDLLQLNNCDSIISLPRDISGLTRLTQFLLSHTPNLTLPQDFIFPGALKLFQWSNSNLKSIPLCLLTQPTINILNLDGNLIDSLPETFFNQTQLLSLSLNSNLLKKLPNSITRLINLTTLSLSQNNLQALPDSINLLGSLVTLVLSRNQITTLPNSITHLSNLSSIDLSQNNLQALPDSILFLSKLTSFLCSNNHIRSFPAQNAVPLLKSLNMAKNEIEALPPSVVRLKNLTSLSFDGNFLCSESDSIPDWLNGPQNIFGNYTWLISQRCDSVYRYDTLAIRNILDTNHVLSVNIDNIVSRFYETNVGGVRTRYGRVQSLFLDSLGLSIIPSAIGRIRGMRNLDLKKNNLSSLPDTLAVLSKMFSLDLRNNKFSSIPAAVSHLSTLNWLLAGYNAISIIDTNIFKLPQLAEFEIGSNLITQLPPEVKYARRLGLLLLSGNKNIKIPKEITQLTLSAIWLDSCGFTQIPSGLFSTRATGLDLYLNGNLFTSLPKEIDSLAVQSLYLDDNMISGIDSFDVFNTGVASSLSLRRNLITRIPHRLIIRVRDLQLSGNKIVTLQEMDALTARKIYSTNIDLSNNLIDSIPTSWTKYWTTKPGDVKLNVNSNHLCTLPLGTSQWLDIHSFTGTNWRTSQNCDPVGLIGGNNKIKGFQAKKREYQVTIFSINGKIIKRVIMRDYQSLYRFGNHPLANNLYLIQVVTTKGYRYFKVLSRNGCISTVNILRQL